MTKFENDALKTLITMKEKELREAAENAKTEQAKEHLIATADKFNELFKKVDILELMAIFGE